MKLSVTIVTDASMSAPVLLRGSYFKTIKKAAKIGYKGVEIHLSDPEEVEQDAIYDYCKKYSIKISSLGTGSSYSRDGLSLSSINEETRKSAVNRIISHIDFASRMKSKVIIGLMRGLKKENESYKKFKKNLKKSLLECLDYAEKKEVSLVLEAINRFECDTFNTLKETGDFIKGFSSDKLKLHIDTFHMNIEERNINQSIIEYGDLIDHVHFADSNRWYPGQGHFDFSETVTALREIGYNGYIAIECLPLPGPEQAAVGAYNYCKNLKEEQI